MPPGELSEMGSRFYRIECCFAQWSINISLLDHWLDRYTQAAVQIGQEPHRRDHHELHVMHNGSEAAMLVVPEIEADDAGDKHADRNPDQRKRRSHQPKLQRGHSGHERQHADGERDGDDEIVDDSSHQEGATPVENRRNSGEFCRYR